MSAHRRKSRLGFCGKQRAKMDAIQRLQAVGLSYEQIAKCLDMTLGEIRQVDWTE